MRVKIQQINIDLFLESNSVGVNGLFFLVYANKDEASERFKTRRYYLPKG